MSSTRLAILPFSWRSRPSPRSLDEKLFATMSLGRITDRRTVEELLDRVEKEDHPALYVALAVGLARNTEDGVRSWLAKEGLDDTRGEIREMLVHAAGELELPAAATGGEFKPVTNAPR